MYAHRFYLFSLRWKVLSSWLLAAVGWLLFMSNPVNPAVPVWVNPV